MSGRRVRPKHPPREARSIPERKLRWWTLHPRASFLLMSALWVALLYGRTVAAPFVYDDVPAIEDNPHLSSWHDIAGYFRAPVELNNEYRGLAGSIYRPLTWLGFIVNRRLLGNSAAGFHLVNLVLHWANGALGFLLLRKLRVSPLLAGAACLIWLGLPINSEAVAWISGRHTCQATFFILTSLLAAICYLRERRAALLLGYGAAVLAALLSNEWGILVLPLTGLVIYVADNRERTAWLAVLGSGISISILELLMRRLAGGHLPLGSFKILPVGLTFLKYSGWMILPVRMSVERSTDMPGNDVTLASTAALGVAIGIFLLLVVILRKRAPSAAAGLAWMSICLLPFSGMVFIYQGMAERYCYLASAGLAFAVVALAAQASAQARPIVTAVILLWVVWGAWRLKARVWDWEDETRLFQSSLEVNPRSQVLLYDLGLKAAESGDVPDAINYYQRALKVNPRYVSVLVNLGNLLRNQGSYRAAMDLEKRALAVDAKEADLWVDLGDTYLKEGSADEAIGAYRKAIALDAKSLEAEIDLGAALQRKGQLAAAQRQYEKAIAIDPQQGAAYCNLGALLLQEGDVSGAARQFQKAVQSDGTYYQAYLDLGLVYESMGRREEAISMFGKVLQLKPDEATAALHLRGLEER